MVARFENPEDGGMKCHVCGGRLKPSVSDFPFRLSTTTIVVIKQLPTLECADCSELSIEDPVMEKVESLLEHTDAATELVVITYPAALPV